MNNKIPFQNRILAFFISIIFTATLILSFFAFPVELVFFNPQSYYDLLGKTEFTEVFPGILSQVVVNQSIASDQLQSINTITSNPDLVSSIIAKKIPAEWVQSTFNRVIDQLLEFLNFKIPTSDMKIDITELKTTLASESSDIASEYLTSLPNCLTSELSGIDWTSELTVQNLPACQPSGKELDQYEVIYSKAFEDTFNWLPSSLSLTGIFLVDQNITDRYFTFYSLARWAFRLLPILSLVLLILIALLLKNQRDVMWKWCGRLLVFISSLTLIGLVILLIGFDQFIAIILNPLLKNLVSGFGYVLLGAVQDVGFQTLVWVIISALVTMGFGLFLILAARFSRPRAGEAEVEAQPELIETEISSDVIEIQEEPLPEKTIIPETLEEVEEKEKKKSRKKKSSSN